MSNPNDVEFDEYCDPNNPRTIKFEDIQAAARRIAGQVVYTPCSRAHMSAKLGIELYFKQEFLQFTASFKERGVRNTLLCLSDDQKRRGVVSASSGNHGSAMSYHTGLLGIPCIVCMPTTAPSVKINKCKAFGANVVVHGKNLAESKHHAMTLCKEKKMQYINGFDHPNICEGQGTAGLEIIEQVPGVEAVICPIGGGSLISGIGVAVKHLKPDCELYGVVTEETCSFAEALRKNERVYVNIGQTLADGLAVNVVGVNPFHTCKNGLVDKVVVVKEDWIPRAILAFVEHERYIVEGAGAVCVAAIMAGLFPNLKGKKVAVLVSGGNINTTMLARTIERGLGADGRLIKFMVSVADRPGGLAELCTMLAGLGITLRDVVPQRAWVKGDVFNAEVTIIAETRGWDHVKEMNEMIKKNYKDYHLPELTDHGSAKAAGSRRGPCLAPNPVCMQK